MKIQYILNQKGDGEVNEDFCGYAQEYAWVIDGATDVFDAKTFGIDHEVSWYMDMLHEKILCNSDKYKGDLYQLVHESVDHLYKELAEQYDIESVPSYVLPTYAMAIVAVKGNKLDYFILGDCSIAYLHRGEVFTLNDHRLIKFSQMNSRIIKDYLSTSQEKNFSFSLFRDTRKNANTKDGYPIGSLRGEGLKEAVMGQIYLDKGDKVIIYSDGCADYLTQHPEVMDRLFHIEMIGDEIKNMYHFLKDEDKFLDLPRPKRVDDCSIILMEV